MHAWRDALSAPFGYRHPDHDTYAFHITFAYQLRRLDDEGWHLTWSSSMTQSASQFSSFFCYTGLSTSESRFGHHLPI